MLKWLFLDSDCSPILFPRFAFRFKSLNQTYQSYLSPDLSTVSICGTKSDFSITSQHSTGEENVLVHDSPRGMDSMVSPNATEDCSLIESETDINCVRVMENQLRNNFTKAPYGITEIPVCCQMSQFMIES